MKEELYVDSRLTNSVSPLHQHRQFLLIIQVAVGTVLGRPSGISSTCNAFIISSWSQSMIVRTLHWLVTNDLCIVYNGFLLTYSLSPDWPQRNTYCSRSVCGSIFFFPQCTHILFFNFAARKWFPITFIGSILWIAGFSYLMVWWATSTGDTFGIPDAVSG